MKVPSSGSSSEEIERLHPEVPHDGRDLDEAVVLVEGEAHRIDELGVLEGADGMEGGCILDRAIGPDPGRHLTVDHPGVGGLG
jgi:hypothetical protein